MLPVWADPVLIWCCWQSELQCSGPAKRIFKLGGGLMRTRQRELTRGSGGMLPRENLKLKSSEMA